VLGSFSFSKALSTDAYICGKDSMNRRLAGKGPCLPAPRYRGLPIPHVHKPDPMDVEKIPFREVASEICNLVEVAIKKLGLVEVICFTETYIDETYSCVIQSTDHAEGLKTTVPKHFSNWAATQLNKTPNKYHHYMLYTSANVRIPGQYTFVLVLTNDRGRL
jgi:hypothetical protein